MSEGFFTDRLRVDIEKVAAAAAEAYAVIYSLDVNRRNIDFNASEPVGATASAEVQSRLDSLHTLALETSGTVVLDAGNRMEEALNQIVTASTDYYIVGFEPPQSALSDRRDYRRVRVSVSRPGAQVASRTGYSLREPLTPADRRPAIDAALGAPFPQQGLPLEMTTYVTRGNSPGAQRVLMSLQADLPVAADAGIKPADVVFVVRDARDGRVVASGTDIMPLPRAAAPGRTTAQGQFRVQFDLPAGDYLLRTAVREPGGTTGTVDRRFEVRALDGVDVTASDLIIGRRSDALPVRPTCYVGEGLSAALEVYARNPVDLESVDVTVDIVPIDGDSAIRSVKADLMDIRRVGSGAGRPAQAAIPLDGVPPGDYVARATLRSRGETVTEVMRQVRRVGRGSARCPGRGGRASDAAVDPVRRAREEVRRLRSAPAPRRRAGCSSLPRRRGTGPGPKPPACSGSPPARSRSATMRSEACRCSRRSATTRRRRRSNRRSWYSRTRRLPRSSLAGCARYQGNMRRR